MSEYPILFQIKTLPNIAGVYQFFDKENNIIYVGKAKNLKKRVASYFTKNHTNNRTRLLVKKIIRVEHIVVETEIDALLLENNLIKKYQPRYNVLLKDDKTYPWICIKNEPFPRVFHTRKKINDGSEYFGPYPNVKSVFALLSLIRELYPLRSCSYNLSKKNIEENKYSICLEYHIGNCLAPCENKISKEEYNDYILAIKSIIRGNFKGSLREFETQMKQLASEMKFEAAQKIKEKIQHLKLYQNKSTVVSTTINNVDVFSIIIDEGAAFVNFLQVSHGAIIRSHTLELKKRLNESKEQLLTIAIIEIRQRFNSRSKEFFLPFLIDFGDTIKVIVPERGDKKKLVELSKRNAQYFKLDRLKQIKITDPERHQKRIIEQIKKDLRLPALPTHIECFDNSNIQGTHPVAACVVFKNAKPSKKDYRHYNIKTVVGPDDFTSMEEVVYRRYKRLQEEEKPLPQLIVIDGGKGQLSSALKSLDVLGLRGKIAIIGIAKRLEEIYFPEDSIPLYLDKKSESLKIIQQLRNEAHRFGITFHRNKRSKTAIQSEFDNIEGIGEKTKELLFKKFRSFKRIKEASLDDFSEIVDRKKAKILFDYFSENKQ